MKINLLKKILSIAATASLLVDSFFAPLSVLAQQEPTPATVSIDNINGSTPPFNFTCPDNPLLSPVAISGSGGGSAPPGQIDQYHVQVDWGDGSLDNELGTFTPPSGQGDFTYTFSGGPHTYTTGGSFTIKARLYHSQPPGADNQADVVASVTVCVAAPEIGNFDNP